MGLWDSEISHNLQQIKRVAKKNGQFTTIQAAIDSITDAASDKKYIIEIAPGEYNEQLTMKDYVSLVGLGANSTDVLIYHTSTVLTLTGLNETHYSNVHFKSVPTTTGQIVVISDGGMHRFFNCTIEFTSSTTNIHGLLFSAINSDVKVEHTTLIYTHSGATADDDHSMCEIDGSSSIIFRDCRGDINIASNNDVYFFKDMSDVNNEFLISQNIFHITVSHATFDSRAYIIRSRNADARNRVQANHMHIQNTGGGAQGQAAAILLDSGGNSGCALSLANDILITGFNKNYDFDVDVTDEIRSVADNIVAADGENGAGTVIRSKKPFTIDIQAGTAVLDGTNPPEQEDDYGTNVKKTIYWFDKTTEEIIYFQFRLPDDYDPSRNVIIEAKGQAKTADGNEVQYSFRHEAVADAEDFDDDAYTQTKSGDFVTDNTQDAIDTIVWASVTGSTLGWAAGDMIYVKFSRVSIDGGTDVNGDHGVEHIHISCERL